MRDDLDWKLFSCFYFPKTFCCWRHLAVFLGKHVSLASVQGTAGLAVATKTSILIWKPIYFLINVSTKLSPG